MGPESADSLAITAYHEHARVDIRSWQERAAWQGEAWLHLELLQPSTGARSVPLGVAPDHGALQDQIGSGQRAAARKQLTQQAAGDPVRRAGHHPKRSPRKPQVCGVGLHDRQRGRGEPLTQALGAIRMQLDGDHAGANV